MKVNVTEAFLNMEGGVIHKPPIGKSPEVLARDDPQSWPPFVLRDAIIESLLQEDPKETGEQTLKRWEIAKKVRDEDVVSLTTDEWALIKERIHRRYPSPLYYGQACEMIEMGTPDNGRAVEGGK